MDPADYLRWINATLGLILALTCCASATFAPDWDQRLRFISLLGFATWTIAQQLGALGDPLTWRGPTLTGCAVLALVSTTAYLIKARRALALPEGRPGDDRPPGHQRHLLRAGPRPGRRRHPGHRARTQSGH